MLIVCTLALAATLAPPAGEPRELWEAPARLAGLTLGAADVPDGVTLAAIGEQLRIRARDSADHTKDLLVALPTTAAQREDAAALGASLLRSLDAPPSSPLLAALERRPVAAARVPAPPRPAPPIPTIEPTPAAPEPPAAGVMVEPEPAPTPPPVPEPEPQRVVITPIPAVPLRPWARVGPAIHWRSSTSVSGAVGLDAGVRVDAVRVGIGAEWDAASGLVAMGGGARVDGGAVSVGAWWTPTGRVAPLVGVRAGAAYLHFLDGVDTVASLWRPRVGAEAGVGWQVAPAVALTLAAVGSVDLGVTTVQLGAHDPVLYSPWEVGGAAGLRVEVP